MFWWILALIRDSLATTKQASFLIGVGGNLESIWKVKFEYKIVFNSILKNGSLRETNLLKPNYELLSEMKILNNMLKFTPIVKSCGRYKIKEVWSQPYLLDLKKNIYIIFMKGKFDTNLSRNRLRHYVVWVILMKANGLWFSFLFDSLSPDRVFKKLSYLWLCL